MTTNQNRRHLRQTQAPALAESLSGACRSIVAESIGQTGTAPRYARASFQVRIDGRVYAYSAMLKRVGGAA